MRPQGLLSLLTLGLFVTALVIGNRVSSAQMPEVSLNDTDGSARLADGASSGSARTAVDPGIFKAPSRSEAARIDLELSAFQDMLQRHRAAGNIEGEAEALAALASSYRALKREQKAIEYFESALDAWQQLGRDLDEATAIGHIGDVYREWGFPEQAVGFYHKALKIYSHISDTEGEAVTRNNIGVAYITLNDKKECFKYLHEALTLYRRNHDRHGEATTLSNLAAADMFFLAKDPQRVLNQFQLLFARLEQLDDAGSEANVLEMVGIAQLQLNLEKKAEGSFGRALDLYRAAGDAQGESAASRHIERLISSGPYRVQQFEAVSMATPDPLHLTAAHLRVIDKLPVD